MLTRATDCGTDKHPNINVETQIPLELTALVSLVPMESVSMYILGYLARVRLVPMESVSTFIFGCLPVPQSVARVSIRI